MAAAASPWSRCSTWSVSPALPATPACEVSPSTPWTRRVTARAATLSVTATAFQVPFFCIPQSFLSSTLPPRLQSTLERCSKCSKPILDRILRAMGKAYHPRCFTCVVCNCCLDGVPFTVDATSQIHCIDDFHRYIRGGTCGPATCTVDHTVATGSQAFVFLQKLSDWGKTMTQ